MTTGVVETLDGPVGHIVHIGAGRGADLPRWLATDPKAVVLVEPDPGAQQALNAAAQSDTRVKVIEAAISSDPKAGPLNRFEFGELNSLRAPTGLLQLFPGLESPREEDVELRDPKALIERLGLDAKAANVLVIEAPGEAMAIVQSLQKAGLLSNFAALRIQTGRESLYQGAASAAELVAFLAKAGFEMAGPEGGDDPDRPVFELQRSGAAATQNTSSKASLESKPAAVAAPVSEPVSEPVADMVEAKELDALREQVAEHKAAATKARREKGAVQGRLTRRDKAFAAQSEELEALTAQIATLEAAKAESETAQSTLKAAQAKSADQEAKLQESLKAAQTKLAAQEVQLQKAEGASKESAAQISDLKAAQTKHAQDLKSGQDALAAARTELAEAAKNADAATARIDALEKAQSETRQTLEQRTQDARTAQSELAEAQKQIADRDAKLSEAQKAAEQAAARIDALEKTAAQVPALQEQLADLNKALEALKTEQAQLKQSEEGLRSELAASKSQQSQQSAQIAEQIQELEKRGSDFAEMKDRATQAEKDLATAQTKQTELRERLDERTKARDSLREQLATVQEKLQAQNQRAADVSAELARTKAQMVAQETSLKGQLGKTETERDTLRKQLETARGQVEAGKQRDGQLALSREEMLRAEGQIELIKDLLLRGPDL